jgi:uracil-DNA glycosylase
MAQRPAGSAKQRISQWLRSERAFGLEAVAISPAAISGVSQAQPAVAPRVVQVQPAARPELFEPVTEEQLGDANNFPFTSPVLERPQKLALLSELDTKEVKICTKCRLCETRKNTVFGEGDADAKIFFIGEGPGENEDLQGRPFVGRAGELLNKMIAGMGLKREDVYIANIVKCRPPMNRVPAPDEVATCTPYLVRQLEIIRPRVIVTLGLPSAKYMLNTKMPMGKLRGQWHNWRGIKLMPTFHPAYLLRSYTEENRAAVWSDLKQVMSEVGLRISLKSSR